MRRGIDGLINTVVNCLGKDPAEPGSIFLFCGHKCDRIKALLYGPRTQQEAKNISEQQYRWLMEGLSVEQDYVIIKQGPGIY